jgi:hypothetical protein
MASQDIHYSCWYECGSDLGHSLITTRQRDGQSLTEMAVGSVANVGGWKKDAFMVCRARVWIGPLQNFLKAFFCKP